MYMHAFIICTRSVLLFVRTSKFVFESQQLSRIYSSIWTAYTVGEVYGSVPYCTCRQSFCNLTFLQVVGFSLNQVALFIAVLCVTSVGAQTLGLTWLMTFFGYKYTIIIGLVFQAVQLFIYGVWTSKWYLHVYVLYGACCLCAAQGWTKWCMFLMVSHYDVNLISMF